MSTTQVWINGGSRECWLPTIELTGGFSKLSEDASVFVRLNDEDLQITISEDTFSAKLQLQSGANNIVAGFKVKNGEENVTSEAVYTLGLPDRPKAKIEIEIIDSTIKVHANNSAPSEVSNQPLEEFTWSVRENNPAKLVTTSGKELNQIYETEFEIEAPKLDGEYYLRLEVTDAAGTVDVSESYFVVEDGKPREVNWAQENPRWVEDTIVYGVVPHNFGPEGFNSVTEKLDYLQELGIDTIWLAPSNKTPGKDGHRYDVSDYFELRPDYGTEEDFKNLIAEAHSRNIKVLMDYVPNHTASGHRYFIDAEERGKESPYYDFYDRDEDGDYTYYFDWTHLPNLNYDNPEVTRMMVEAISYWIREFNIDGYRVDAIWGVRQRRPDFWPMMREELQRIKPDMVLIAEASARDPYYVEEGFDSAYDWSDELGHWAWETVFTEPEGIAKRLHAELTNHGKGYAEDSFTFRFLNNNDTAERFLTRYGADLKRVGAALYLTLDGIPCVYTGEENGIEFSPYYTPEPISFEDRGYRDLYKKLISIRNENPALRSRVIIPVTVTEEVYGYGRYLTNDESNLVWLNFSDKKQVIDVELPAQFSSWANKEARNLLNDEKVTIQEQLTLAPWEILILTDK